MCESCSYEEGDYVIECASIFQYGKLLATMVSVADDEDYDFILKHMKDNNFYPNVWMLSDHGNLHLVLNIDPLRIKCPRCNSSKDLVESDTIAHDYYVVYHNEFDTPFLKAYFCFKCATYYIRTSQSGDFVQNNIREASV